MHHLPSAVWKSIPRKSLYWKTL